MKTTPRVTTPISALHIAEIARHISSTNTQVGCWYYGDESGDFGRIDGSSVCLDNGAGFVFVANTPETAGVLIRLFGHAGAMTLLAKSRRQREDAIRKDFAGMFTGLIEKHLSDGWQVSQPNLKLLITGNPSKLYREKPSDNGNGWFAGSALVHEYGTRPEIDAALKAARRRVEDRLRKDVGFCLDVLRGDF